jgi:hypothetical protein
MSFGFSTKKPLPAGPAPAEAGGFYHPVVSGAIDQRVELHGEHRGFRDRRPAGSTDQGRGLKAHDADIVEDDDPRFRVDRCLTGKL